MDLSGCISWTYDGAGSYQSENSWTITDAAGNTLASGGGYGYPTYNAYPESGVFGGCVGGCTDVTAFNYDASLVLDFDDGSCVAVVNGCTDTLGANYNALANTDDGSCTYGSPGCTDMTACNYDAAATADDGSCTFAATGYDCAGACLVGEEVTLSLVDSYGDSWNGNNLIVNGVSYTDASAAGQTDHVVCMDLSGCISWTYDGAGSYQSENSWTITDAAGNVLASGGVYGYPTYNAYPESGVFGGCVGGCTDSTAFNYDASLVLDFDDGSCVAVVNGCTDTLGANYDALANTDDGSCTY
jgi:hypothetical protein